MPPAGEEKIYFSTEVRPGDRVLFLFDGAIFYLRSREYIERVRAGSSVCEMKYRESLGWDQVALQLSDLTDTRIMIGNRPYHPDKIVYQDEHNLVTELIVTPEMIDNRESATLSVLSPLKQTLFIGETKLGFLGYGHCPDQFIPDKNKKVTTFNTAYKYYYLDVIVLPADGEVK